MNSTNVMTSAFSSRTRAAHDDADRVQSIVRVKELSERDCRSLLMHFLGLDGNSRLLRFGSVLSDELITRYVQKINFSRDSVFGVYDGELKLVGSGHLAYVPREAMPLAKNATSKERIAEFGVAVSSVARGVGIGTKLFERAAMHCRNADIDTLYIHCLSSNQAMLHIARKAKMEIHRDRGESDAYLKLRPSSARSMLQEAVDEQIATLDYGIKANSLCASKWLENIPGIKAD